MSLNVFVLIVAVFFVVLGRSSSENMHDKFSTAVHRYVLICTKTYKSTETGSKQYRTSKENYSCRQVGTE